MIRYDRPRRRPPTANRLLSGLTVALIFTHSPRPPPPSARKHSDRASPHSSTAHLARTSPRATWSSSPSPTSTSPLSPLPARIPSDDLVIVALTNENLSTTTSPRSHLPRRPGHRRPLQRAPHHSLPANEHPTTLTTPSSHLLRRPGHRRPLQRAPHHSHHSQLASPPTIWSSSPSPTSTSPPSPLQARSSSDDLVIIAPINEHLTTLTPQSSHLLRRPGHRRPHQHAPPLLALQACPSPSSPAEPSAPPPTTSSTPSPHFPVRRPQRPRRHPHHRPRVEATLPPTAVLIGFSVALTNEHLGSSPPSPLQARISSDDLVIVALINEHLTTLTPPPSTSPLSPLPARISSDDLVIVALTNENLTTITPDVLAHDHSSPLAAVLNGRHRRHSAASWVSKALLQRTDSANTRRLHTLPLLGEFASLEPSSTSAAYSARAQDLDDRPVQTDSPTHTQPTKKKLAYSPPATHGTRAPPPPSTRRLASSIGTRHASTGVPLLGVSSPFKIPTASSRSVRVERVRRRRTLVKEDGRFLVERQPN